MNGRYHAPLPVPTTALPGSPEKVQVLCLRAALRQELFHQEDATGFGRRGGGYRQSLNVAPQGRLQSADRCRRALALRRLGYSFDAIARRLGYANKSGAYLAVQVALGRQPSHDPAA